MSQVEVTLSIEKRFKLCISCQKSMWQSVEGKGPQLAGLRALVSKPREYLGRLRTPPTAALSLPYIAALGPWQAPSMLTAACKTAPSKSMSLLVEEIPRHWACGSSNKQPGLGPSRGQTEPQKSQLLRLVNVSLTPVISLRSNGSPWCHSEIIDSTAI